MWSPLMCRHSYSVLWVGRLSTPSVNRSDILSSLSLFICLVCLETCFDWLIYIFEMRKSRAVCSFDFRESCPSSTAKSSRPIQVKVVVTSVPFETFRTCQRNFVYTDQEFDYLLFHLFQLVFVFYILLLLGLVLERWRQQKITRENQTRIFRHAPCRFREKSLTSRSAIQSRGLELTLLHLFFLLFLILFEYIFSTISPAVRENNNHRPFANQSSLIPIRLAK